MVESSRQALTALPGYRVFDLPRLGLFVAVSIPAIGIPVVLLTRLLAWVYQPQLFEGTLPTISKTAAFAPASWLFIPAMTLVAAAIVLAWPIAYVINRREILRLAPGGGGAVRLGVLNAVTMLTGMVAGFTLGALAIIHLEVDGSTHMLLSKTFFSAMILALLCDSLLAQRLGKLALPAASRRHAPEGMDLRYPICLLVFVFAFFFLFMFLTKDTDLIPYPTLVRWMYVTSETVLCMLLLLYSLSYLPLLRRVMGESPPGSGPGTDNLIQDKADSA